MKNTKKYLKIITVIPLFIVACFCVIDAIFIGVIAIIGSITKGDPIIVIQLIGIASVLGLIASLLLDLVKWSESIKNK